MSDRSPVISDAVRGLHDKLVATRREIHRHPEPGFREVRTAALVAERLRRLRLDVRTGIAETGVLGILRGGNPGKTILVRADMDALPLTEDPGREYGSTAPGYMHACGHDAHVSMALATAEALAQRKSDLKGNIVFCFQPAEEGPGGALPMIQAGVLDEPRVEACVGLHVWSDLPAGQIGVRPGPLMASVDEIEIVLSGRGGHGAAPHQTRDLVVAAAHVVTALQTVKSRRIDPQDPVVVTIAAIHGGQAFNIIPDKVSLRGTIRTFDARVRDRVEDEVRALVTGVGSAFGAEVHVEYRRGYPTTVNDPGFSVLTQEAAAEVVGSANVVEPRRTMGGEDMSYFLERVPGCFFFLGTRNEERGIDAPHHCPRFDIDESAMIVGVQTFLRVIERYQEMPRG